VTLLEAQRIVVRLLVDVPLRERFLDSGTIAIQFLHPRGGEVAAFDQLRDTQRLGFEFFSDLLFERREQSVRGLLPATAAVLGPSWSTQWIGYLQGCNREGMADPGMEARGFAEFLARHKNPREDAFASAVCRFEYCKWKIEAVDRPQWGGVLGSESAKVDEATIPRIPFPFLIEQFPFDVARAVDSLTHDRGCPVNLEYFPNCFLFYTHVALGRTRVARIASSMAALLNLCDGHRTIEEIALKLSPAQDLHLPVARLCVVAISKLVSSGVVSLLGQQEAQPRCA